MRNERKYPAHNRKVGEIVTIAYRATCYGQPDKWEAQGTVTKITPTRFTVAYTLPTITNGFAREKTFTHNGSQVYGDGFFIDKTYVKQ